MKLSVNNYGTETIPRVLARLVKLSVVMLCAVMLPSFKVPCGFSCTLGLFYIMTFFIATLSLKGGQNHFQRSMFVSDRDNEMNTLFYIFKLFFQLFC